MAEFIEVREVGLRDGIQNIKTVVPTDLKLAWIKAEVAAGVRDIEVCSFVPPKLLPQFADAEEVTQGARSQIPGLTVAALMPNLKGAERGAALGVHRLDYVVSVSESHNLNNVRRSTAESLADLQRIADFLQDHSGGQAPAPAVRACHLVRLHLEGNVPHDRVVQFAEQVAAIGVDEIALADTVGFANPNAIRTLFKRVRAAIGPKIVLAVAFPRHARARHRECRRPRSTWACATSMPRCAGSAAARSRPARPATSSPRTWCSSPSRSASTPASISTS